jgi:hypothetical protein
LQSIIDIALKGRQSIGQAHWHNQELIVAIAGLKGGFPFISFLYSNSVVGVKEVDLAKDLGTIESIKEFTNKQNRVAILDSKGIETSIIYTKSQGTILLRCKNDRGTCRAHGFPDVTFLQSIMNEFF